MRSVHLHEGYYLRLMILRIAWRYIRARKSVQAVQWISRVSTLGMAIGAAALIVVLSVYNGFDTFIRQLYTRYYPDLKIIPKEGKTFVPDTLLLQKLQKQSGIAAWSMTLEEKVVLHYPPNQQIATLKGVDQHYPAVSQMQQAIRYGRYDFSQSADLPPMVIGLGMGNRLGVSEESHFPVSAYVFPRQKSRTLDISNTYRNGLFEVQGVFVLQSDLDQQVAFVPYTALADLCDRNGEASTLEIRCKPGIDPDQVRRHLQQSGVLPHLTIQTRYEQNRTLYFILNSERWAVYALLSLMLCIASFTMAGTLSMLVLEKQNDIAIFKAMGMSSQAIQSVFLLCGILLSLLGALMGLGLGLGICWLQKRFGWVKLSGGDFLLDAYPVEWRGSDFILVSLTVVCIAVLASWIPAYRASRQPIRFTAR